MFVFELKYKTAQSYVYIVYYIIQTGDSSSVSEKIPNQKRVNSLQNILASIGQG